MFDAPSSRVSKSSPLVEALGTLDELNSFLGLVKVFARDIPRIKEAIRDVQEKLFMVQAEIGGADKRLVPADTHTIEKMVNDIETELPPLKGFSVAGGTELSASLDVARAMSRRAERALVRVAEEGLRDISEGTKTYLNRLSSLLFALARLANHEAGINEENPKY